MEDLLHNQDLVISILTIVIAIVGAVITFVRTGSVKKSIKNFEEVFDLKYKTSESKREKYAQSFTPYVDDYMYNSVTGDIEKLPTQKNVDDYIQSHIETCLERALEKFLPKQVEEDDYVADYTQQVDDLAALGEAMELAEMYREKFNLPDNYSVAQIYGEVDKSAKALKDKLVSAKTAEPKEEKKEEDKK
ncbi:hypothetical protein [Dipodfec virus UOA04_Rod_1098]|nr:hypothetical protein [Dipodfec virus UOA04_Rod_1098]